MERVTPLLVASDLTIGHGGTRLIPGIDMRLDVGRVLCLLGPNGVGKTTLFRTLMGLIPSIKGSIFLGGENLSVMRRCQIAQHIAHVPQSLATPFAFTALDVVLMGAAARLGPFARPGKVELDRAMVSMDSLGIADLVNTEVTRLSGGQRQLVLIARALAQQTRAIIMDEPTASLDFANRRHVGRAIRQLAESGTGIILSSHDPDQAAALADEVLLLDRTGLLVAGPVHEVMTGETLSHLYGIPVRRHESEDGRLYFN